VLAAVATHTEDAVIVTDAAGIVTWVNHAFVRQTGYPEQDVLGAQPERLLQGPDSDRLLTMRLRAALIGGEPWSGEIRHYRKDGTVFWHELSVAPIPGSPGSWRLILGRDVSERRMLARRFLELFAVVELSPDGIVVLDEQQHVRSANAAFARLHGFDSGPALQGRRWRDFYDADTQYRIDREIMPHLALHSTWHGEVCGVRTDGSTTPLEVTLSLLSDGIALVARDIAERLEYEEALQQLTLSDPLTGLYNRRGFDVLATQLLAASTRQHGHTLLLYFDLNRFKVINDRLGHATGDAALVEVAEVLRETFRESDLVARIGGDEFVALAVNSNDPTGDVILSRLDQRLAERNGRPGREYALSIGRGVARFDPMQPLPIAALLAAADAQLMAAKREAKRTGDYRE
jgi:diguanylate cyclase (GGDEF)-like protein/PAS domain S-box-containing protein